MKRPLPVFFHPFQLEHRPLYEWSFGTKLDHPETSQRAERILEALTHAGDAFSLRPPPEQPLRWIREVHDPRLVTLYKTAQTLEADANYCPSVFPKRHQSKANPADIHQAGFFCFDSGTPLNARTFDAAAWSAACAHEASRTVESGEPVAYALCRPPGHHAQRDLFGGYCYFNNAAIVAARLREKGRVAIVDIDFHHGNGTQAIFWRDPRVLFISIHGDPREFYPYFSGYPEERGGGAGEGFTMNLPLPRGCDAQEYFRVVDEQVLPAIRAFDPASLVLSAGFDTYREDPIGGFALDTADYHPLGERFRNLRLPTVVLQEGGYFTEQLGTNVVTFLSGLS